MIHVPSSEFLKRQDKANKETLLILLMRNKHLINNYRMSIINYIKLHKNNI